MKGVFFFQSNRSAQFPGLSVGVGKSVRVHLTLFPVQYATFQGIWPLSCTRDPATVSDWRSLLRSVNGEAILEGSCKCDRPTLEAPALAEL